MLTALDPAFSDGAVSASPLPASAPRWRWARPLIEGTLPSPRGGHTATLVDDRLFIFGGHKYGGAKEGFVYHNDLHVLHLKRNQWLDLPRHKGTAPKPRYGHSAVLVGKKIVVFGGKGEKGKYFADLHALETDTLAWYQGPQSQPNAPSPRFGHSCNLDGTAVYIFGGVQEKDLKNDLHCINLEDMSWSQPLTNGTPPCPRFGHAAIIVGQQLIVCGGMHRVQLEPTPREELLEKIELKDWYLMDICALDLTSLTWYRVRTHGCPPPPRFGHSLAAVNEDLVVFGGWAGAKNNVNTVTKDTSRSKEQLQLQDEVQTLPPTLLSRFDTTTMTWMECTSVGNAPKTRYGHSCTQVGSKLILFGGWDASISLNDVVVLCDLKDELYSGSPPVVGPDAVSGVNESAP